MRLSQIGAPVPTSNRDHGQLGDDDRGADRRGHLLGGLDAQPDVALGVADDDDGLEAGALAGARLLLDGLDLLGWGVGSAWFMGSGGVSTSMGHSDSCEQKSQQLQAFYIWQRNKKNAPS